MSFDTKIKPNYTQASFATQEEIFLRFPRIDLRMSEADRGGGIVVHSDGTIAYVDDSDNSSLTIGSIGSKKSRDVVMPHIVSAAKVGTSMVIHAPKADILKMVRIYLMKQGYRVMVLDFREPERGERYNPFEHAAKLYKSGKKNRAREMFMHFAMTICEAVKSEKDSFWHVTSARYLAGLAELLCIIGPAEEVTIDNIYNLHLQGDAKIGGTTYMKSYFDEYPNERCWKLIYPVVTAPNETRNSLNSVFTSAIVNFIQNDAIVDQTSHSTFQAEDLLKSKTALFLISRDEGSVYDAMITAIIDQLYSILTDIAERQGGTLDRKVSFILDEFGNLAALSDVQKKLTLSRARGITWHFVVQSLEQLSLVYGDKCAQIIIENCNNIIYLYSPDIKLVKHISELCGEKEGENNPDVRVPLCPVDMLKHLEKGEALMLIDRMRPFITRLPDISQYYGIEQTVNVDVKKRKQQNLRIVDFKSIVEKINEDKINKIMNRREEEYELCRKRNVQKAKQSPPPDIEDVISIINNVIFEMMGG